MAAIGQCCSSGQGLCFSSSPGTAWAFSRALEVGLGLGQGRVMWWPACSKRGAICVAPGKVENRLTCLCKDPARAGVVDRQLAFTATVPSLKNKNCQGEVDLPDQMG